MNTGRDGLLRFPVGSYSKLKNRNFRPCQILEKISNDGYVVDQPEEFNTSSTFNIADLRKYYPAETDHTVHSRSNVAEER